MSKKQKALSASHRRQFERNLPRAFALMKDVIAHPDAYPDDFVAIPLEPDTIRQLFSHGRVRVWRTLRDDGPFESVAALARALRRATAGVRRDVEALHGAGLVELERQGKQTLVRASRRPIVLA